MIVPLIQIKWQHKSLSVNIQPSPQISIIRNCSYWIMMVYPTEPQTTVSFSTSSYWASLVHLFMNHWKSNRMELHTSYTDTDSIAKYVRFPRFYNLIRCSVILIRQRGWDRCRVNLVNARISQSRTRREIQGTSRWWYAWRRDGRRSKDRVLWVLSFSGVGPPFPLEGECKGT